MLPEYRTHMVPFPIPKFALERQRVDAFIDELKGYHEHFADCFSRREPREHFFRYTAGQLSQLENKFLEPSALKLENGDVRSLQCFVSEVVWNEGALLHKYHAIVREDMGTFDGAIFFDELGFPKKGTDSAGVAKQMWGNQGKLETCQVGVFAAYASPSGYAFLDKRLFVPQRWFTDEYQVKRTNCAIPEQTAFRAKDQLAADILDDLNRQDVMPYRYVFGGGLLWKQPRLHWGNRKESQSGLFIGNASRFALLGGKPGAGQGGIQIPKRPFFDSAVRWR
ncbi:MAG: transposase [Candidatus Latescibacterota bacterium]